MKYAVIALMSLISTAALADGYRCQGGGYRVKLYNQTQPELGTKNPAVMIVSSRTEGTIAVLDASKISKTNSRDAVTYEGVTNSRQDGRFVSAVLEIEKEYTEEGDFAGFSGELQLTQDGARSSIKLACDHYRKQDR